jgi:hypothetical protein
MLSRSRLAWVLCAAAPACGFDSGHDYSTVVTWLINGTAPSPELCEEQGVDRVRFTVRSPSKRRTLEAPCSSQVVLPSDGLSYGGFVTTQAFDYGVSYDYEVEMLDDSGQPIPGLGYSDTYTTYYGDYVPFELAPLELWDPGRSPIASARGSWTFAGAPANNAICAQLGAAEVAIEVASSTDANFEDYYEVAHADCADGVIDSVAPALAEGEYVARYVLFSADDEALQEIPLADGDQLFPFQVDRAGELHFDPVDFDVSVAIP